MVVASQEDQENCPLHPFYKPSCINVLSLDVNNIVRHAAEISDIYALARFFPSSANRCDRTEDLLRKSSSGLVRRVSRSLVIT